MEEIMLFAFIKILLLLFLHISVVFLIIPHWCYQLLFSSCIFWLNCSRSFCNSSPIWGKRDCMPLEGFVNFWIALLLTYCSWHRSCIFTILPMHSTTACSWRTMSSCTTSWNRGSRGSWWRWRKVINWNDFKVGSGSESALEERNLKS